MDTGWESSAEAWIALQGDEGDVSRRLILDPALEPIFADVSGKSVLDVGCGEGRYCRKVRARGALPVGIDPVVSFVERARQLDPQGEYHVGGAESLPFADASFDIVLSYLTLVDVEDDLNAISEMCRVLGPGGEVVVVTVSNMASTSDTWVKEEQGNRLYRTVDRYMENFAMELSWGGLNVVNFHRPLSRTLTTFFSHGTVLTRFLEPLPPSHSEHYEAEFRVPTFQIYSLAKMR